MPEWFYVYQDGLAQQEAAEGHIHFGKKSGLQTMYFNGIMPEATYFNAIMPAIPMFNKAAMIKGLSDAEKAKIIQEIELEDHYLRENCRPHVDSHMCNRDHYHPITGRFRYSCKQRCCGMSMINCKCPIERKDCE